MGLPWHCAGEAVVPSDSQKVPDREQPVCSLTDERHVAEAEKSVVAMKTSGKQEHPLQ